MGLQSAQTSRVVAALRFFDKASSATAPLLVRAALEEFHSLSLLFPDQPNWLSALASHSGMPLADFTTFQPLLPSSLWRRLFSSAKPRPSSGKVSAYITKQHEALRLRLQSTSSLGRSWPLLDYHLLPARPQLWQPLQELAPEPREAMLRLQAGVWRTGNKVGHWLQRPLSERSCRFCHTSLETEAHLILDCEAHIVLEKRIPLILAISQHATLSSICQMALSSLDKLKLLFWTTDLGISRPLAYLTKDIALLLRQHETFTGQVLDRTQDRFLKQLGFKRK